MTEYTTKTLYQPEATTLIAPAPEFAAHDLNLSATLSLATTEAAPLAVIENPAQPGSRIRTLLSRWFSQEFRTRLRQLAPWLVSGSILGLNLMFQAPTFVIGALIATLTVRVMKAIVRSNPLSQRLWAWLLKKANLSEKQIPWMALGVGGGAWLSAALPSSALFFQAAQNYVQQIFAVNGVAGVDAFTPLIFGVLRVIFIIYIGIALVRVISAFRNDEDWSTAARIPLIVVLCVVIGDALSTLIVQ
jgi:hypothetical protein